MVAILVGMHGRRRHAGQRRLDLILRRRRHELVLGGDVAEIGPGDRGRLAERAFDADAVVADVAIGIRARRHQIGELAAEAESHRADAAGASGIFAQRLQAGDQVGDALGLVKALVEREGLGPFGLGLVGDLDPRLLAPEEIGAHGDVALLRKAVAEVAHHLVDAEDLLDDQDARAAGAGGGRGDIGGERAGIAGGDLDVGHGGSVRGRGREPNAKTAASATVALHGEHGGLWDGLAGCLR